MYSKIFSTFPFNFVKKYIINIIISKIDKSDESDDKMRKYLVKLEKTIEDNKWTSMVMIMDDMTFLFQSGTDNFNRPKI